MVTVTLKLDDTRAEALAQFVKRIGWHEFRENAVNDNEAYFIKDAIIVLQESLIDAGYSPR